jgi:hypothetical protein
MGRCPASSPGTSWPTARDVNGGAASSLHLKARPKTRAQSWAGTRSAACSTAGFQADQACATKRAGIRTVRHQSDTSTTSPGTATADRPHSRTGEGPVPAATTLARCPAGTSASSIAGFTENRTPSTSPHPPATTPSAEHPTHHERGTLGSWEHVGLCASCSRRRLGPGTSVL